MKKKSKIGLTIVSVVLVVILVAGLIYFFGASYPAYEVLAKEEFNISGLSEGFIPQGISYDRVSGKFLLSGYMNDTSKPSRVYVVDSETQDEKYVTFTDGGEDYFGHAGGVAVYGNFAYIAGDGKVHEVNLDDVLNANNGDKVEFQYTLDPGNGADCLTVNGNELWVGEFYKKGNMKLMSLIISQTVRARQTWLCHLHLRLMRLALCQMFQFVGFQHQINCRGLSFWVRTG